MFGISMLRFRFRNALLGTAELVVFFMLNMLARITSVHRAALVADWISHCVPRNRMDYMLVDAANYWIDQKTSYQFCRGCYEFVIEPDKSEWHEACWTKAKAEPEEYQELDDEDDPRCSGCGNYNCRGDCEEQYECPGGCGQLERDCVCPEIASWNRHNADPATRGSTWIQ